MHGRAPVAAAFAGHAMVVGTLASRLPAIKSGAGLTDARLGAALFAMAVGTLAGSRLGGTLATRHGARRVVRAGMPLHGLMLAAIALPDGLAALAAVMLCAGIVGAAVDIAMNAEAVVVERASGRPLMSGLHGMWSVGLLIGAGLGAGAAAAGLDPAVHFAAVAVLIALGTAPFVARLPAHAPVAEEHGGGDRWSVALVLLGAMAFCSFVAEGSAADWSAIYLHEHTGAGQALAAAAVASFSVAMAASRLAGDALAARFGPVPVTRVAALVAVAGLGLALAVQRPVAGLIGFALFGAGLAPIVPTVVSAAAGASLGRNETVVSRIFTIGYVGSIIGPAAIGGLAGIVGLRAAMVLPALLAAAVIPAAGILATAAGRAVRRPEPRRRSATRTSR